MSRGRAALLALLVAVPVFPAGRPNRPTVVFRRVTEPREGAFSLLVPAGWQTEGGITRVNPTAAGGAANAIEAKLDFTLKRDAAGSAMMRWLPSMRYADLRGTPVGNTGMFPPGSNYAGMTVLPLADAASFLARIAFPYAHRGAQNVRVIEKKPMPGLAEQVRRSVAWLPVAQGFTFDAAMLTVTYEEGGRSYQEKLVTAIHNWGSIAAGMWENKETFLVRAAPAEFDQLAPILAVIQCSVKLNRQWVMGEMRGQMERGKIAGDTYRYMAQIDKEIVEGRQRTNAEINKNMFLTLTGQAEYLNPHTGKVEYGSNQWKHRWVSPSGEEIYCDDENYNPSYDRTLQRTDFKRTPPRQ
ncbi:MAG: hypothetical protein HY822_18535 [Acidobacteria bacterium]|nr:hypothetical protein [Acidobacteriota bacterium]